MTFTLAMLAPNGSANQSFTAGVSGNSYTSDVYGLVKNVLPQDALALEQAGCLSLGITQARSNLAATVAPTSANDVSQDYAIGSRWLVPAAGKEYVCSSATLANAVWNALN